MTSKKYLNISEVSKMLQIEEHKIRYWDSIDPKTNKYRIEGISTKSKGGTRYFNKENIKKIENLCKILYDGEKHNYSIRLAEKILSSKSLVFSFVKPPTVWFPMYNDTPAFFSSCRASSAPCIALSPATLSRSINEITVLVLNFF